MENRGLTLLFCTTDEIYSEVFILCIVVIVGHLKLSV